MFTLFHYLPPFSLYFGSFVWWPLFKFRALSRIKNPGCVAEFCAMYNRLETGKKKMGNFFSTRENTSTSVTSVRLSTAHLTVMSGFYSHAIENKIRNHSIY